MELCLAGNFQIEKKVLNNQPVRAIVWEEPALHAEIDGGETMASISEKKITRRGGGLEPTAPD